MPEVFPPPKANPITVVGGLIAEFFYSWVVAISDSNNAIENRVSILESTPTFTAPTLVNNWVNFGAPNNPAGYYKDSSGRVFLRGLIKDGLAISGTGIFVLPEGFRPANTEVFIIGSKGNVFPRLDPGEINIGNDGIVIYVQGDNEWLSFDGISFLAAT